MLGKTSLSRFFLLFLICFGSVAYGLEYLSDDELARLDGYTSDTMQKEYDDEGNVIFRRGDNEACRFNQSESDGDSRMDCEPALNDEIKRLGDASFQRYLDQSLALMTSNPELDTAGDGLQTATSSLFIDDASLTFYMCSGVPSEGLIHLDGISVLGKNGRPIEVPVEARIDTVVNASTGRRKKSLVVDVAGGEGIIKVDSIRIGVDDSDLGSLPSIGRLQTRNISPMTVTISLEE